MLSRLFRWGRSVKYPPYDPSKNPWRAKRIWPPDFSKLSPKEQFKFERRFRRRHKMKWLPEGWVKTIKITQWGSILVVVTYAVFFYEDKQTGDATSGTVRDWYRKTADELFPSIIRPNSKPVAPQRLPITDNDSTKTKAP